MIKKVTILGAGSFGTALAQVFSDCGCEVLLYTNEPKQAIEINKKGTNKKYYKGYRLNEKIMATDSLPYAINNAETIVIALPSPYIRTQMAAVDLYLEEGDAKGFINFSKGIEPLSNCLISDIIAEEVKPDKIKGIAVVSGPSFAQELMDKNFTAMVVASENQEFAFEIQSLFDNARTVDGEKYIRLYTSTDVKGVQLCGSVKNVLALAAGIISKTKGYGENARAALLTRGLHEMTSYLLSKGAKLETIIGLAGLGDLILTANSEQSRNFKTGERVATGMHAKDALLKSKHVVEGVRAAYAIDLDATQLGIDMPITKAVCEVFYESKDYKQAISEIIDRELKSENKVKVLKMGDKNG